MMWEQEWSDNHTDTDMPPGTAVQLWTITAHAAVTCSQSNTPLGQVHDQCTCGTIYDVCRLTRVVARVCWLSKIRDRDYSAVTHCQSQLKQPYGQVPDQQKHTALSHRIALLTTLDYFASQRCGFEALYENTPNPHWIFSTIQYVLISSPNRKFLLQCTTEETTCCLATAE